MTVIFWKIQCDAFNALAGKTSLDLAVEKYAKTGDARDLKMVQTLIEGRKRLAPNQRTPLDVVVNRVVETGNPKDFKMLQALVNGRRQKLLGL